MGAARLETDKLFSLLHENAWYERPIDRRHRLIFYLGHVDAFDWVLLGRRHLRLPPLDHQLDALFEAGIDPPAGQEPQDRPEDWPTVEETRQYVGEARRRVDALLESCSEEAVQMAIEHRLMHAETLAYLLHCLPFDMKEAPAGPASPAVDPAPAQQWMTIPQGAATLGRRRQDGFGWDNEFEEHSVQVPAFQITRYKITNGEYLEFVEAGGPAPHYWTPTAKGWAWRGMFSRIDLPLNWPVYVSWRQAQAFAEWKCASLPTEAQFHRAAYGQPGGEERSYPWGEDPPSAVYGNFDFLGWDPVAVTLNPAGDSAFGVAQLVGNGWEWTSSPFAPFPGFRVAEAYPAYSAPFFDGQHYVLKGACCRTAARLLRRSFRNWFRDDYRYAYTAFRLVRAAQ